MYRLDPAFDFAFEAPNRLLFSGPGGEFIVQDTSGLIQAVLKAVMAGKAPSTAFEGIKEAETRQLAETRILDMLRSKGVLRAGTNVATDTEHASEDPFCDWLGFVGGARTDLPALHIAGQGALSKAMLAECEAVGLATTCLKTNTPSHDEVVVYCQDRPSMSALREANQNAVEAGAIFLPVQIHRHVITLGPLVLPGATACAECVHHRSLASAGEPVIQMGERMQCAVSPFVVRMAAMLGVQRIAHFMFGAVQDLHISTVTRHSVLTGQRTDSVVLKVPRCPVCGGANARKPLVALGSDMRDIALQAAE